MESALFKAIPRIKQLLARVESECGATVTDVRRLKGSGNDTFLIVASPHSFVLRMNRSTAHLGVNRHHEREILQHIAPHPLTPSLAIWHEDYLVLDYAQPIQNPPIEAVAEKLAFLHNLEVPDSLIQRPAWNPYHTIEDYLKLIPELETVVNKAAAPLKTFDWSALRYGLCHADLNPHNILGTEQGVRFIDWEYGRHGPCAYDVAVFVHSHNLDARSSLKFMTAYCGESPTATLRQGVKQSLLAYRLIESLWLHLSDSNKWPVEKIARIISRS